MYNILLIIVILIERLKNIQDNHLRKKGKEGDYFQVNRVIYDFLKNLLTINLLTINF